MKIEDPACYNPEPAVLCLVAQSCPTVCNPMEYIARQTPLSMGIPQARILEWVAMPSSRGSSQSRDRTNISYVYPSLVGGSLTLVPPGKPLKHSGNDVMKLYLIKKCPTFLYINH